jgi:hypothetical protein
MSKMVGYTGGREKTSLSSGDSYKLLIEHKAEKSKLSQ